jgi:hypothetical protein
MGLVVRSIPHIELCEFIEKPTISRSHTIKQQFKYVGEVGGEANDRKNQHHGQAYFGLTP